MDAFLARLGVQAMNMAIRSGIALTSTYAVQQCSKLMKTVDDKAVREELKLLQRQLNERIKIICPAIDLIEFKSGRGNIFLETALPLAKSLRQSIVALGKKLEDAAESSRETSAKQSMTPETESAELRHVIDEMKNLLSRIERDAQMLQFAINASGENLSTSLPPGVSPSRLLQASTFLIIGDTQFANDPTRPTQIGPSFTLSLYMLFVGHSDAYAKRSQRKNTFDPSDRASLEREPYGFGDGERKPIWQEVIHKARVRLCRIPSGWNFDYERGYLPPSPSTARASLEDCREPSSSLSSGEYAYHLEIVEDLDDGRIHDSEDTCPCPFDDIMRAGIRESIPVHQLSKIFYTDTGRILNIGNSPDSNANPALLLKRDVRAPTPTQVVEGLMQFPDGIDSGRDEEQSTTSDLQAEIDAHLRGDSGVWGKAQGKTAVESTQLRPDWRLPRHLDTEWLALEVFIEDDEDSSSSSDGEASVAGGSTAVTPSKRGSTENRSSLDSKLIAQIRNISLSSPQPGSRGGSPRPAQEITKATSPETFVSKSPFCAITSSLSLMEMLIRLTSLQEFQQASHLSIPDHILTFFLEETSTTGLHGEERRKARDEAKRKVGFDPFVDTPAR